jgi:branched-chain amino acid transport system ATP-binding protein
VEGDRPLLEVDGLQAYYGLSHVLHAVSLRVAAGEAVAVLGRNGAGKTTTLKAIAGVLQPRGGQVRFEGEEITGLLPYQIVKRRISWVPEERRIFPNLTVYENLKMSRLVVDGGKRLDRFLERVFALFPPLAERIHHKGRQLSGGEQQMLTIARGLGCEPRLLLIDEPTEGLMPELVRGLAETLTKIQEEGVAILLVEQNVKVALEITRRTYLIEKGTIRWGGLSADLARDYETRKRYLGV